jgi:NifU-like protein involved in Fe-S cluster formation
MDEVVIRYYRRLLREGFQYCGTLENPSIYLDSVGEKIRICGHVAHNYMHVYINITDNKVCEVKYLCVCDPTANVVAEVFCTLIKNKTLAEAEALKETDFAKALGSTGDDFLKKAGGMIELLRRGLARYQDQSAGQNKN